MRRTARRPTPTHWILPTALALTPVAAWAEPGPDWEENPAEIGVRLGYMELEDADSGQTLPTGGVGAYLRVRLGRRLGLEAALDAYLADQLGGDSPGEVVSVTAPLTVSALVYLYPESDFNVYLLGGLGLGIHSVTYEALGLQATSVAPAVQLGLGAQYREDELRFDLSLRSLWMSRGEDSVEVGPAPEVEPAFIATTPVDYEPRTGARSVVGAMLTFGIHFVL